MPIINIFYIDLSKSGDVHSSSHGCHGFPEASGAALSFATELSVGVTPTNWLYEVRRLGSQNALGVVCTLD